MRWEFDPAGRTPGVTGGLYLRPDDLARIGQLVLDEGMFDGRQLISRGLMKDALSPLVTIGRGASAQGLGWMLGKRTTLVTVGDSAVGIVRASSLDAAFKAKAEKLKGTYRDWLAFDDRVEQIFGSRTAIVDNAQKLPGIWSAIQTEREADYSYVFHTGDGGNYLYIFPAQRIVALRMVRDLFSTGVLESPEFKGKDTSNPEINRELGKRYMALIRSTGFDDFPTRIMRLK